MTHDWLAGLGGFTENLAAHWHIAPANEAEAFFGNDLFNDGLFALTLFVVAGEKYEADTVVAFCWHVEATLSLAHGLKEVVWQLNEDTCAVTSDGVTAATTTVVEVYTDLQRTFDDVVGFAAFHVDNQADSAVFVFILWVVETLRLGLDVCLFHISIKYSILKCSHQSVRTS